MRRATIITLLLLCAGCAVPDNGSMVTFTNSDLHSRSLPMVVVHFAPQVAQYPSGSVMFRANSGGAGHVEFDSLRLEEVDSSLNLVIDGDMESASTTFWAARNNATRTKKTKIFLPLDPHGRKIL